MKLEARMARIREAISEAKIPQSRLAEQLGISKQLLTHWLQGRRRPSDAQLRQLGKALGLDASFVTGAIGAPAPATLGLDSLADAVWEFRDAPLDGGRDYGNANVLAFTPDIETLVRELGQNALDQLLRAIGMMHLRFTLIELTTASPAYEAFMEAIQWERLQAHLKAAVELNSRLSAKLRRGLAGIGRLRLLLVEDFGTTGAYGHDWTSDERGQRSPFAALMRDNLNSSKETNVAGGTHGAGKGTAWQCSDISTVLLSSSVDTSHLFDDQPDDALRFIGKSELTWHPWPESAGGPKAGPGWLAHLDKTRSLWLPPSLLKPLFLDRSDLPTGIDESRAGGTSLLIVGFRDPQGEGEGDADATIVNIKRATAENFFPAMLEERMTVSVEHHVDGVVRQKEVVDPSKYVPEMAEAYRAHLNGELIPHDRAVAGDTTHVFVTHPIPATRSDVALNLKRFEEDQDATSDLIVRFAKSDELGPTGADRRQLVNRVAPVRGRRMIVEYMRRSNLVVGGRPFHAIVLAGEAAGEGLAQTAAEQFLRLAEPPSHNKWIWREDVRDNYRIGAKQDLSTFYQRLNDSLRDLIKPVDEAEDDGPDELRKLLFLAGPNRTSTLAVVRVTNQHLDDGQWHITAEVAINDRKKALVLRPTISVQPESGAALELDWDTLSVVRATRGAPKETGTFEVEVPAGTTRLVIQGVSKARSDSLDLSRCKVAVGLGPRILEPSEHSLEAVQEV
jgi:transcriptional regulator with XRE-family HTH domain